MSDFVPPYPPRLSAPPSNRQRLSLARKNIIAMWEESAFELDFSASRVLFRWTFLCNSPEAVQFAFSLNNATFERKSPQMRHALEPLLGDGLFISDGETWRQRRRIVAPIVHVSRLSFFVPIMAEAVAEMRDRWASLEGQTIDVLAEAAHLTAEIICRAVFGRKLGRAHAHEVVDSFSSYQREVGQIDLMSLIGLPDWVPRPHAPRIRRAVARIDRVLADVIASYRQQDGDEAALIGSLLDARDESGQPLDTRAIRNEAAVLFMAGHETTANTMAWTWYLVSQAPDCAARLRAELDSVLGGRIPTLQDIPKLVYTRAVIEEAMRLYPPVPILPREALAEASYNGQRIPKGSLVLVVPWLLHRHRNLWERPDHFEPERFLPERSGAISKYAYIPFSIGPRVCAGMSFGLTEAILCFATLAQSFELQLAPGYVVRPVCRLTLRPEGGLPMIVRSRRVAPAQAQAAAPQPASLRCPVRHG